MGQIRTVKVDFGLGHAISDQGFAMDGEEVIAGVIADQVNSERTQ